jgi:two-component system, OmpR family, response regulator RegX3
LTDPVANLEHILVVEDDELNRRYAERTLQRDGYSVTTAASGAAALAVLERCRPDLILLDIGLPDANGIEICQRLRARTHAPIIFVSGHEDELNKVLALDAGGDDYVTKPFGAAELTARIRAVLRRGSSAPMAPGDQLEAGPVLLNRAEHRVHIRGAEVSLTPKEFELLELLLRHVGRALRRQEIFDAVWGTDFVGDTSGLDGHVRHLRQKLELDASRPHLIQTVHGVGYRFVNPSERV